ncbi:EthD family reductase [Nocardia sp. CY41]|uniref:EthD family reductase n=1 Tax=Nocardia sp. CY41 TaxID=2608686 RepID=UPI001358FC64|nr:EthD family reductase [Nocardia sp. CY41]
MYFISVCYRQPEDQAAFDKYYAEIHTPLVLKIPKLVTIATGKCVSLSKKEAPFYMVANLYFETAADLEEALRSPEMQAAGADVANFASGGVVQYWQEENVIFERN